MASVVFAVSAQEATVMLSGANEIPPVTTSATGTGMINVAADRTVTVRVVVNGMTLPLRTSTKRQPDPTEPSSCRS